MGLPRDEWVARIGSGGGAFNPGARLSAATGRPQQELRAQRRAIRDTLVVDLQPLPGVREWLQEASALGLRVGIASSSDCGWVKGRLKRVGLVEHFDGAHLLMRSLRDRSLASALRELFAAV